MIPQIEKVMMGEDPNSQTSIPHGCTGGNGR